MDERKVEVTVEDTPVEEPEPKVEVNVEAPKEDATPEKDA